jgi:hypothetical protein
MTDVPKHFAFTLQDRKFMVVEVIVFSLLTVMKGN